MSLQSRVRGFTLVELLVVLAVMGLALSMVAPSLERTVASVDRAARRDGLVADLAGLSYRAYALGQPFELSNESLSQVLADGNPVLGVPWGWRVEVERPIRFSFNGWCSGGAVKLVSLDGNVEQVQLVAPDCRLQKS